MVPYLPVRTGSPRADYHPPVGLLGWPEKLSSYPSVRRGEHRSLASHERAALHLFNDLIRPQQQRRRDGEAERLGGLEIDDQLELVGLLDGQVAGLGAL